MFKLNHLMRVDATLSAKVQLLQNMDQIKESFNSFDPYVQAILIQSVINFSATEFEKISKDYFELISIAKDSPSEWVRRKAFEFSEYPKIKIDEDIQDTYDIAPLKGLLLGNFDSAKDQLNSEEENLDSDQVLEMLDPNLRPPSDTIKPSSLNRTEQQMQPRPVASNPLSIPSALTIPSSHPNTQLFHNPTSSPSKHNISSSSSSKKKKQKEFSDNLDFMNFSSKKRK